MSMLSFCSDAALVLWVLGGILFFKDFLCRDANLLFLHFQIYFNIQEYKENQMVVDRWIVRRTKAKRIAVAQWDI